MDMSSHLRGEKSVCILMSSRFYLYFHVWLDKLLLGLLLGRIQKYNHLIWVIFTLKTLCHTVLTLHTINKMGGPISQFDILALLITTPMIMWSNSTTYLLVLMEGVHE